MFKSLAAFLLALSVVGTIRGVYDSVVPFMSLAALSGGMAWLLKRVRRSPVQADTQPAKNAPLNSGPEVVYRLTMPSPGTLTPEIRVLPCLPQLFEQYDTDGRVRLYHIDRQIADIGRLLREQGTTAVAAYAKLVREPRNQYDNKAVSVRIGEHSVGYLYNEWQHQAREYLLADRTTTYVIPVVIAKIPESGWRGGWIFPTIEEAEAFAEWSRSKNA